MLARSLPAPIRWLGRMLGLAVCAFIVAAIGLQFVQYIARDYALSREMARTERDIHALQARNAAERREIRRLHTSEGVVPYIYSRLRMVRPGQTLIYLVPSPGP